MHLTLAVIEATYELLRATPPFRGWRMPTPDDVIFTLTAHPADLGCAGKMTDGQFYLEVSGARHAHLTTLIPTVAHEMVHLREEMLGRRADVQHGARFKALAAQVCRHHGFDPKWF